MGSLEDAVQLTKPLIVGLPGTCASMSILGLEQPSVKAQLSLSPAMASAAGLTIESVVCGVPILLCNIHTSGPRGMRIP